MQLKKGELKIIFNYWEVSCYVEWYIFEIFSLLQKRVDTFWHKNLFLL